VSAIRVEELLARLYVDADARRLFLSDPRGYARRAGLAEADVEAMAQVDRVGLELAARSFEAKRAGRSSSRKAGWLRWLGRARPGRA
jgi:hypothetical protein